MFSRRCRLDVERDSFALFLDYQLLIFPSQPSQLFRSSAIYCLLTNDSSNLFIQFNYWNERIIEIKAKPVGSDKRGAREVNCFFIGRE